MSASVSRYPVAQSVLDHIGVAFIVAGIGVLFYEWSTHIRAAVALTEDLQAIKSAVGENALTGALRTLLRSENAAYDEELIASIGSFVEQVRDLQTRGDWAKDGYVRFLYRMQRDVTANAENLRRVSVELRNNPTAETAYRVKVKSPGALTDIMLAEQMRRLPPSGRYSIASNPVAWHGHQLSELHEESRNAVGRGVLIRRIFVLYGGLGPHGHSFDMEEADDIIRSHFQHSREWRGYEAGGYEIRLLDEVTRIGVDKNAADFILQNHFGVFEWPRADHSVLVQVTEADLSNLTITGLHEGAPYMLKWETVWAGLPVTTVDVVEDVLARWRSHDQRSRGTSTERRP
jgi:hypothetical protein